MLSSSRMGEEAYLTHALPMITSHLSTVDTSQKPIIFIPYAGVTMSYDEYTDKVTTALGDIDIKGIHEFKEPKQAVEQAGAIMVGGGNTFRLLEQLYQQEILAPIQQSVNAGLPYIGWSAGSNICGLSIRTTNDMPIIEPPSFDSFGFVGCQINPHYTDYQPPNHNGETRDQRLAEFTTLNPNTAVIAIREGTALLKQGDSLTLQGSLGGFVFRADQKLPISSGDSLGQFSSN